MFFNITKSAIDIDTDLELHATFSCITTGCSYVHPVVIMFNYKGAGCSYVQGVAMCTLPSFVYYVVIMFAMCTLA